MRSETIRTMDLMANSASNKVKYDITLTCEIENDIDNNGFYIVKGDSMTFKAKSKAGDKYKKGDIVNVLVPKGDYSAEKIIQGKYSSIEEPPKHSEVLSG